MAFGESHPRRDEAYEMLRQGKSPQEVAEAVGATVQSARAWKKTVLGEGPKVIPTPDVEAAKPASKGGSGKRKTIRPMGAEKCAALLDGAAGAVSIWFGAGWRMDKHESATMGETLADCLVNVPAPILDAAHTVSSPLMLVSQLGAYLQRRILFAQQLAAEQQAAAQVPEPPRPQPTHEAGTGFVYGGTPPPPPRPVHISEPAAPVPPPPPNRTDPSRIIPISTVPAAFGG